MKRTERARRENPILDPADGYAGDDLAESWPQFSPADWIAIVDGKHLELENDWDLTEEALDVRPRSLGHGGAEETAEAFGIRYADGEELRAGEKEQRRDSDRWELDPASSEDYGSRQRRLRTRGPTLLSH
jgi:hypothetical protein